MFLLKKPPFMLQYYYYHINIITTDKMNENGL